LLNLSVKQPKKCQDRQAYSHFYWNGKLKQEVQGEWDAHKKTMLEKAATKNAKLPTFPDGAPLSFHNKVVQQLFYLPQSCPKSETKLRSFGMGPQLQTSLTKMSQWMKKKLNVLRRHNNIMGNDLILHCCTNTKIMFTIGHKQ
jgi:hypothetical protein